MGDRDGGGIATGALLILVGVFLVSRTLSHDDHGFNLVDRMIAIFGGGKQNITGSPGQVVGKLTAQATASAVLQSPGLAILQGKSPTSIFGPLDPFGPAGQIAKPKPKGTP